MAAYMTLLLAIVVLGIIVTAFAIWMHEGLSRIKR
jgi:hypothetical protein